MDVEVEVEVDAGAGDPLYAAVFEARGVADPAAPLRRSNDDTASELANGGPDGAGMFGAGARGGAGCEQGTAATGTGKGWGQGRMVGARACMKAGTTCGRCAVFSNGTTFHTAKPVWGSLVKDTCSEGRPGAEYVAVCMGAAAE